MADQLISSRSSLRARVGGWLRAASRSSKFRLYVALVIVVGIMAAAWSGREPSLAGLIIVLVGMGLRLWASGHLHKRQTLAVSGPYRWVRHPLYLGTLIAIVGGCALVDLYPLIPVALAIMVPIYLRRVASEEAELRQHFGPVYEDYCARVPRLLPSLRPGIKGDGARFSFRLALANHWHHGLVTAMLVIVAIDLIEDVFYPWLVGNQPLTVAARELLDFGAVFRTGRF